MKLTFLLIAGILFSLSVEAEPLCDRELIMGWESWPPYQYVDEDGLLTGIDINLAKVIFGHAGCQLSFVELPWKRHLSDLESGRVDIASGASYTQEREQQGVFTTPYRQELVSLFVRSTSLATTDYADLDSYFASGSTLGVTLGYYYGPEYEKLLENPTYKSLVAQVRSDPQLFQMLTMKRIDGFLADPYSVYSRIRAYPEVESFRPALHVYAADIHFMLSKQSFPPEKVRRVNRVLEELKAQGVLYGILKDYKPPELFDR